MRLTGIGVGGDPVPWEVAGFTVDDGCVAVANGALLLDGLGLYVDQRVGEASNIDGVPLSIAPPRVAATHDNGAFELDHFVLLTNSLERTSEAVADTLGLECRRIRETPKMRQAFHRFDDVDAARGCIIEVVEQRGLDRTTLMGVVFNVRDLDALAARMGDDVLSRPKPAVQPGRRIATFRPAVELPTAVALMTQ